MEALNLVKQCRKRKRGVHGRYQGKDTGTYYVYALRAASNLTHRLLLSQCSRI